jgi:hypothetical protein
MHLPTLQQFFRHQLQQSFHTHGLNGAYTIDYVADVLGRFAYTRFFYAVHDAEGRPIEYIVDMLMALQSDDKRPSVTREGVIMRHIGDYTLFMSGLFRERVRARGEFNYYVAHGRSAFWRSADYEINPARRHTFRRLYQDFEPISNVLDYLRRVQLPRQRGESGNLLGAFWQA